MKQKAPKTAVIAPPRTTSAWKFRNSLFSMAMFVLLGMIMFPVSSRASHGTASVSDIDFTGMGSFSDNYTHSNTDHPWVVFNANAGNTITFTLSTAFQQHYWIYQSTNGCVQVGNSTGNGCLTLLTQGGNGATSGTYSFTAPSTGQYAFQLDAFVGQSGSFSMSFSGSTATTVLCNPTAPTFTTCPGNQTATASGCAAAVTYTAAASGGNVTYAFSGATAGSGSGTGSGSTFNMGVTNVVLTATNTCGGSSSTTCSFTVTVNGSEINVVGNGNNIVDGDNTPTAGDNTDFGTATVGNPVSKTFTIQNSGAATLNIGTISFSGTNSGDFSVTTAPPAAIAATGSGNFVVTFNPSSAGSKIATINISNSDCNENPYDYVVSGSAINTPAIFNVNGGGAFCFGGAGVLVGLSGSETGVNYQLQVNGNNIGSPVAGTGSALSFGNQTTGGTYTVVATRVSNSSTSNMNGSAVVNAPSAALSFVATPANPTCGGGNNGSITVNTVAGGLSPYQYSLNAGAYQAGNTFSNLAAGTYGVNVKDAAGCVLTQNYGVVKPFCSVAVNDSFTNCTPSTIQLTLAQLIANDTIAPGDTVSIGDWSIPTPGSFNFNQSTQTFTYTPPSNYNGPITFTYTIKKKDNALAFANNGHFYEYMPGSITWTNARNAAATKYYNGMQGYLVTVTSQAENDFVQQKIQSNSWMGASDLAYEGTWRWVTGPEGLENGGIGRHFSNQAARYNSCGAPMGSSVGGYYHRWEPGGEPNDCGAPHPTAYSPTDINRPGEHVAHFYTSGTWNDFPDAAGVQGYVVEYGGMEITTPVTTTSTATVYINNVFVNAYNVTGGGAYCAGGAGVAVGLNGSQNGINYQLRLNGSPIGSPVAGNGGAITFGNQTAAGTYTILATSVIGNCTKLMTGSATVSINNLPTFTSCPSNISINTAAGVCYNTTGYTATATGTPAPSLSYAFSGATTGSGAGTGSGSAFNRGVTNVTVTATNTCGSVTCNFTVTVNDNQNPTITAPSAVTVNADNGVCKAGNVNLGSPVTGDNCGVQSTTNDGLASYPVGNTTVTWTVTDINGNTATATQTVTVVDNQNPTITCPANITVNTDLNSCFATNVGLGAPTTNDNCGVQSTTNNAPTSYPVGNTTVVWTVTDIHGRIATCNQTVTVKDNQKPVIACPSSITVNNDAGVCGANVNYNTPTATDNCTLLNVSGSQTFTYSGSLQNWMVPAGVTSVTIVAKGAQGGGSNGGLGATIQGTVNVTPGEVLKVVVGGAGQGGGSTFSFPPGYGHSGGGGSFVTKFNNSPLVIAGGGGGAGIFNRAGQPGLITTSGGSQGTQGEQGGVNGTGGDGGFGAGNAGCGYPGSGGAGLFANGGGYGNGGGRAFVNGAAGGVDYAENCVPSATGGFGGGGAGGNGGGGGGGYSGGAGSTNDGIYNGGGGGGSFNGGTNQLNTTGNNNGNGVVTISWNVGSITQVQGLPSGATFPVGTTTNTYVATDVAGNKDTCSFTVTVNAADINVTGNNTTIVDGDNTPSATDGTDFGGTNPGVPVVKTYTIENNGTASLNVSSVNVSGSHASAFTVGGISLPTTVAAGSSATFTVTFNTGLPLGFKDATITVNNSACDEPVYNFAVRGEITCEPAVFTSCPSDITVNSTTGLCNTVVNYIATASGTPAPAYTYTFSGATTGSGNGTGTGSVFNVGTTTVTVTATNPCSNPTCSFTVTVVDNEAPAAICKNITVQLDATGNASIVAGDVNNNSSDNCGVASVTASPLNFTCANVGANNVTLTVTDIHNNTSTCTAIVTVEDNVAPVAIAQNITVQLDATGNTSITAADVNNGSNDACGIQSMAVAPNSFTCANVGANTVTLTVTDNNNNVTTTTATVTVEDNVAPVAIAQNITVQLDATGNVSITAAQVDNGSNDACGIQSMTVAPNSFTCANVGTNDVVLTVTDNNGNISTASAVVTVEDNVAPVAIAQNIIVQLDATGNTSITAAQVDNGSSDACGIASMTVAPNSFTCANVGANTVTLTVTDVNGNVTTNTATVTVQDNVAPVVLTQNITIQLDASGNASITAAQINNGSSDACGIATVTVAPSSFTCANVGANTVTLTVTDVNGNVATNTATVTVQDNIAPVALCKAYTLNLSGGTGVVTPANVDNGSNDACGIASMTVTPNTFTCANAGNNTVVLTVTDVNGNVSTCTAVVTVQYQPTCNISVTPANTTYTGGVPTNIYIGYGPQTATITANPVGGSGFTYLWTGPTSKLSCTTCQSPVFNPGTTPGTYTYLVKVTNSNGCFTTCTVTFCVKDIRDGISNNPNSQKVFICHAPPGNPSNTQQLSISINAVPSHLGQHDDDRLGKCGQTCGSAAKEDIAATEELLDNAGLTEMKVFPNPTTGVFYVELPDAVKGGQAIIMDMSGKLVQSKNFMPDTKLSFDLSGVAKGVYMIQIVNGAERYMARIVVQE
jgi:hypothetical protein